MRSMRGRFLEMTYMDRQDFFCESWEGGDSKWKCIGFTAPLKGTTEYTKYTEG